MLFAQSLTEENWQMLKLEKVEVRFQVKSVRKNFFAKSLQKVSAGLDSVCDPCADMISRLPGEIMSMLPFCGATTVQNRGFFPCFSLGR